MTDHYAGELAYIDTMRNGMVPVKVTEVVAGAAGHELSGSITVKVTATRGAYRRGEVIAGNYAARIVPRSKHHYRAGIGRISPAYAWRTGPNPNA